MSDLLNSVVHTVCACGQIMLAPFTVSVKDGVSNIVTSADQQIEGQLKQQLLTILPEAGFLGEEGDDIAGSEYCFVVDPIDGTSNFARGIQTSAISVGLLKNGEPYLGVVYNPFTGELYSAEKGCGAFQNGKPIHVSSRDFAHGLYYTALSLYRKEFAPACMSILEKVYSQCDDFRREGSAALELCRLASGCAELYFEIRVFPWDVCAAQIILAEAGGCSCRLYPEGRNAAQPFPILAANCAESLDWLKTIVLSELPALPANYYA